LREEREAKERERKEREEAEERKRAEEQMEQEKNEKEQAVRAKAEALVQERRAIQERAEEQLARARERGRVRLESQSTEGRFVPNDPSNRETSLRLDAPSFEPSWIDSRANRGLCFSMESVLVGTASGNSQLKVSAASFEPRTTTNFYRPSK
jgi:hypothetical protein